jgi:uncharacterized membrane protein HdeD (DUF308 family)
MKRSAIFGLLLALLGIVLFAHLGIARAVQKETALHKAAVRRMETAQKAEQAFPLASLLAGFFFMSGVGLVAVSAHPVAPSQRENFDGQESDSI